MKTDRELIRFILGEDIPNGQYFKIRCFGYPYSRILYFKDDVLMEHGSERDNVNRYSYAHEINQGGIELLTPEEVENWDRGE